MPQAVITTARLILRPAVLRTPRRSSRATGKTRKVTRYLVWKPHASLDDTRAFVQGCIDAWAGGVRFPWVITRATDGQLLGMFDTRIESGFKVSVGYVLAREHWERLRPRGAASRHRSVLDTAGHLPHLGGL